MVGQYTPCAGPAGCQSKQADATVRCAWMCNKRPLSRPQQKPGKTSVPHDCRVISKDACAERLKRPPRSKEWTRSHTVGIKLHAAAACAPTQNGFKLADTSNKPCAVVCKRAFGLLRMHGTYSAKHCRVQRILSRAELLSCTFSMKKRK